MGVVTGLGDCRSLEPSVLAGGQGTGFDLEAYGRSDWRRPAGPSGPDDPRNDKVGHFLAATEGGFQCHVMYHSPGVPGDSGGPLATNTGLALGAAHTIDDDPPASNSYTNIAAALEFMKKHQGWAPQIVTTA